MDERSRFEVRGKREKVRTAQNELSLLPSNLEPRTSISGRRRSSLPLWSGILCGPVAFAINLQLRYALVRWACTHDSRAVLIWIAVPLVVICIAGALLARTGLTVGETETANPMRVRFMAYGGLMLSAIFAITILASMIPDFFLTPCD
jgi:hypothetical protein